MDKYCWCTFRKDLVIYKQHNVTFEKSQIADLFLNPRFSRVPDDMNYFVNRMKQKHQNTKILFSGFEAYRAMYDLLLGTTKFTLAGDSYQYLIERTLFKNMNECPPS